ncbi:hypothetical protein [Chengkuizengella axinellae]|uniref:Uncharacterized protein n=1 Tax=Chengkuizengella axinellae TaxID=3064388 RepID=A0ABT9IY35_9BACL|nr:hypothetical protein [Chengkuizengella sp. 2205SS18-9]MDP5274266.1 hypothetical protein [Chengkuizengella sp. 2205SS18-9]
MELRRKYIFSISLIILIFGLIRVYFYVQNDQYEDIILTDQMMNEFRQIAWSTLDASEKEYVIIEPHEAEVELIQLDQSSLIHPKYKKIKIGNKVDIQVDQIAEKKLMKMKSEGKSAVKVTLTTKFDSWLGSYTVVIDPKSRYAVGFYPLL